MLSVREARLEDMPRVLELYAAARQQMRDGGNTTQWRPGDAPEEKLEGDMARHQLFVVTDGPEVCGVFAFLIGPDPTYAVIEDGAWQWDDPYGTVHRLAGGRGGVFDAMLRWARQQISHLRADTHADNLPMQHLLASRGFRHCGTIHVPDGTPRLAYEWHRA
jgi:RimJ/RimL family protein N-acetyltransferase